MSYVSTRAYVFMYKSVLGKHMLEGLERTDLGLTAMDEVIKRP